MPCAIPSFEHAAVTRDERGVYTLCIVNAHSINILGAEVCDSLAQAALWISRRDDARAVLIRGSGERAFAAGTNVHQLKELDPDAARAFIARLSAACEAVRDIPIPTIARITGHCIGVGMELAAACDVRLGSDDARFAMPEVRIGIPSVIHAALLPALMGVGATRWLLLTGEAIDAAQALRWGFLQFSCPQGELDALTERTLAPILANGPRAVRQQKALLRQWEGQALSVSIADSIERFGDAFATDEPARFMAPFTERKKKDIS